jgi:hypothetical protein
MAETRSVVIAKRFAAGNCFSRYRDFTRLASELCGNGQGINPLGGPPSAFVASPVKLAVM